MTKRCFLGKRQKTKASISQLHSINNKNWFNICFFVVFFFIFICTKILFPISPNIAIKGKKSLKYFFPSLGRFLGGMRLLVLFWCFLIQMFLNTETEHCLFTHHTQHLDHINFIKSSLFHFALIITNSLILSKLQNDDIYI